MTPINPQQFEQILETAVYDPTAHTLSMIVQVPAGARKSRPEAHLVAWNNHTAESVRLEICAGWPVVGVAIQERSTNETVLGFGLADRRGRRYAGNGETCARCKRPFNANEIITAGGACADDDACISLMREHEQAAIEQRVYRGSTQYEREQSQARRDGDGGRRWMWSHLAHNGYHSVPTEFYQRAVMTDEERKAKLEQVKAETLASIRARRSITATPTGD